MLFLKYPIENIEIVVLKEKVLCTNRGACTQLVSFRDDRDRLEEFSTSRRPWLRKGDQIVLTRQRQKTYGRNASIKYRYRFPEVHNE